MDLLDACNELRNVIHTAQILVSTWEDRANSAGASFTDKDDYSAIEEHLTDLASELRRIERGES